MKRTRNHTTLFDRSFYIFETDTGYDYEIWNLSTGEIQFEIHNMKNLKQTKIRMKIDMLDWLQYLENECRKCRREIDDNFDILSEVEKFNGKLLHE